MAQLSSENIFLASALVEELASSGLPPALARLYSHHTRLRENQPGLVSWSQSETNKRLEDVFLLLEASFVQKQADQDQWKDAMLRAAEILEWLPTLDQSAITISTRLLSAACYQLAGYPARALGLLQEAEDQPIESRVLTAFLKADFVELFQEIRKYWTQSVVSSQNNNEFSSSYSQRSESVIISETVSALGVLCSAMRWGNDFRIQKALSKLTSISKVMLHNQNPYDWILSKLCAEVAVTYVESSMRKHLEPLLQDVSQLGRDVFERYLRQGYQLGRSITWPSQKKGIQELVKYESFALCTPTGSGKTTVAELAILQSLFLTKSDAGIEESSPASLVLYLVPSRALATEVEAKLSNVLRQTAVGLDRVTVTGLYGGTDWGPTDAWLTVEENTVLICTYEKAEALMKFLGSFFISRAVLVVIDEAHTVQFTGSLDTLQKSENRSLRLESLGARLFNRLKRDSCRVVALSAVAEDAEDALARWVSRQADAQPIKTFYKSTRQLIGRLECGPSRRFEIRYDLLDGSPLSFNNEEVADQPYIPRPFPPHPPVPLRFEWKSRIKGERASFNIWVRPYLFWAAMHLATPDVEGRQRAVLISISQMIDGYTKDFLDLLNRWPAEQCPNFFEPPTDAVNQELWNKCLESCSDYYTVDSREYQLLTKGVVVHHGKMPGLMARLLIEVVQRKIVHLVMATSTLSEGVNLPFETVLIPNIQRYSIAQNRMVNMSSGEFGNLVGRAGRPGFGTEGRSLILVPKNPRNSADSRIKNSYLSLTTDFCNQQNHSNDGAVSPLSELIKLLKTQWKQLVPLGNDSDFMEWLEQTAPISYESILEESAVESLDSLDNVLLAAIVEIEQVAGRELDPNELESELLSIWQTSYSYYASQAQAQLNTIFVCRGKALKISIYPSYSERRRLYKTSLPPRSGHQLLIRYQRIREHLETGEMYLSHDPDHKFLYICNVATLLAEVPSFHLRNLKRRGNREGTPWDIVFRWWLDPQNAVQKPSDTEISGWHKLISENFYYRVNWGLGSVLALAMDEAFGETILEPSLANWPRLGLPWIVFWIKELVVWGTLDPVAAYLLSRVDEITNRSQAESLAQGYYRSVEDVDFDEQLDPRSIRDWTQQAFSPIIPDIPEYVPSQEILVTLTRDFSRSTKNKWHVIPVVINSEIRWSDPAGFPLAVCPTPENWQPEYLDNYDFELDTTTMVVRSVPYLR